MKIDFEVVSHTAGLKLRIYGSTLEELFKNALIGMFQSLGPHAVGCRIVNDRLVCPNLLVHHIVDIEAFDLNSLLVDFICEALFLSDLHNQAYLDVVIHEITHTHLIAKLHGIQITGFEIAEIKSIAYHNVHIKEVPEGYEADIVCNT